VVALFGAVLERRMEKVTCIGTPDSYLSMAKMELHQDLTDIVLPGVLADFDLPDLVQSLGLRCVLQ
jgi:hypothetical protein